MTISVILSACSSYGTKITYHNGKSELYYTSKVTKAEAEKLGDYLVENQFYQEDGTKRSVQLTKDGSTYQVRFPVKEGLDKDQDYIEAVKAMTGELSSNVFDGANVEIHLCTDKLKTLRVVIME